LNETIEEEDFTDEDLLNICAECAEHNELLNEKEQEIIKSNEEIQRACPQERINYFVAAYEDIKNNTTLAERSMFFTNSSLVVQVEVLNTNVDISTVKRIEKSVGLKLSRNLREKYGSSSSSSSGSVLPRETDPPEIVAPQIVTFATAIAQPIYHRLVIESCDAC
jgi:hypothetical protein